MKTLILTVAFACVALAAPRTAQQPETVLAKVPNGAWSDVFPLPLSPISGSVSPTGELLMWSGNVPGGWLFNYFKGNGNRTFYSVFSTEDFLAQKPIQLRETFTTEMFCPGTSNMPDGKIMVNGGSGPFATIMFDPATKEFSDVKMMNLARGYQGNVVTTGDRVFTVGGSFSKIYGIKWLGKRNGEVFTPGGTDGKGQWDVLNNVLGDEIGGIENGSLNPDQQGLYRSDNHVWLFSYRSDAGDEMVFQAGPVANMHIINVSQNTMIDAGPRGDDVYSMNGVAVQFLPGLIYKTGGATAYGDTKSQVGLQTKNEAYFIDYTKLPAGGMPVVTDTNPMNHHRAFLHGLALPGGKIFIVGGQTNLHLFEDTNAVLEPELFDPAKGTYQRLAPMKVARNYHSVALLTKFGTIWVGGGGAAPNTCTTPGTAPCTANVHFNGEVFTPPYLSQGQPRPTITSVSGDDKATFGTLLRLTSTLTVAAAGCGATTCSFELVRMSSATHSVNNDQLRIPLKANSKTADGNGVVLEVREEDRPFVLSGYYYLFAVSAEGTPSVAETVQLLR